MKFTIKAVFVLCGNTAFFWFICSYFIDKAWVSFLRFPVLYFGVGGGCKDR